MLTAGVDGRVHFRGRRAVRDWLPYVFGGYARMMFLGFGDHALQYGIGLDYRTGNRHGVRVEFRDLVPPSNMRSHYWTVRLGMTVR